MKVIFTYKNGRKRKIDERYAVILQKSKLGTYEVPAFDGSNLSVEKRDEEVIATDVNVDQIDSSEPPALDEMSLDELHALARERGIKIHRNAGAEKVKEALRG